MSDRMDLTPHINYVTTSAVQSTYALRVLRAHGLSGPNLWDVSRSLSNHSGLVSISMQMIRNSMDPARSQRRLTWLAVPFVNQIKI